MHEIDLSNFDLRTDLIVEQNIKNINSNRYVYDDIVVEDIILTKNNKLNKKAGKYVTISYKDITDITNYNKVLNIFKKEISRVLDYMKINENDSCLIIGLGNSQIISDALGCRTLDNIIVTRHLYILNDVSDKYRNVSILKPNVIGVTGIDSFEIIKNIVNEIKPNFVIAIDALCAADIRRLNKTIQITTSGITPGSGIGNERHELSKDTLGVKVIAIGVPTVVDTKVIVSDTLKYLLKKISYLKNNSSLIDKIKPLDKVNYLDNEYKLENKEKQEILGHIGLLDNEELKRLIWEVLSPIESDMIVTVKDIDFIIDKLSKLLSDGINKVLHHID